MSFKAFFCFVLVEFMSRKMLKIFPCYLLVYPECFLLPKELCSRIFLSGFSSASQTIPSIGSFCFGYYPDPAPRTIHYGHGDSVAD